MPLFSRVETIELFDQISYPNVKKYYILADKANFCKTYCNVIAKIYEENIINDESILWWLEDAGRKFASENNLVKSENSYK